MITVVRRLLRGERVSMDGSHVHLDGVQLDQPPAAVPPVLAGVNGPKSLAMAGRTADGLVLADWWGQIGPIGILDDARAHLDALASAGANSIALVPEPDTATALTQLDAVGALLR